MGMYDWPIYFDGGSWDSGKFTETRYRGSIRSLRGLPPQKVQDWGHEDVKRVLWSLILDGLTFEVRPTPKGLIISVPSEKLIYLLVKK